MCPSSRDHHLATCPRTGGTPAGTRPQESRVPWRAGTPAGSSWRDEERALIAWAQRDPEAVGILYARYADGLYAYALHVVHDPTVAEDVVAETFQRVLEHLPRYQWRGLPLSAWLYRIARNAIASRYRRAPLLALAAPPEVPEAALGPEALVLQGEHRREVRAAVSRLPLRQQHAVVLRYSHDLPYREIARILGQSEGAAKDWFTAPGALSSDIWLPLGTHLSRGPGRPQPVTTGRTSVISVSTVVRSGNPPQSRRK